MENDVTILRVGPPKNELLEVVSQKGIELICVTKNVFIILTDNSVATLARAFIVLTWRSQPTANTRWNMGEMTNEICWIK